MYKIFFVLMVSITFSLSQTASANPLTEPQQRAVSEKPALKKKMQSLLKHLESMDSVANRLEMIDYKVFAKDAREILKLVAEIRKLDDKGVFSSSLDILDKAATALQEKSAKKNPEALIETNRIANACFKCHQIHRGKDL